ncbi:MAG: GNAT family N-acetyltransferase [Sedimentisphaerales bacterium]|nr:GNAT family N-acetyltransferase [Sedimentisphaerales bacterium]
MIRDNLDALPDYGVPDGYSIRWYQPGDEQSWCNIHVLADKYTQATSNLFVREFGSDIPMLTERQCYLFDRKEVPVGTACAWFDDQNAPSPGRVHWVAIVPEEQGKGLAKTLLSIVCHRLKKLGHKNAYLTTQTVRIPAINLYLKFGFTPAIDSERDKHIWRQLQNHLKYPIHI